MNHKKLERTLSRFFAVKGNEVKPSDREVQHFLKRMQRRGILITVRGCVCYELVDLPVGTYRAKQKGVKHA